MDRLCPLLSVTESGTYQLSVNNGCVETVDEIHVTIKVPGKVEIPNVVTFNGDGHNDHFLLPPEAERCSLRIFNRWGKSIFYAKKYQNNWPKENLAAGVYFYTLHGECMPVLKGAIHVMN